MFVLIACVPGTVAAGVFTQNRFCCRALPLCREHLAQLDGREDDFRALVINAGNANAGTGAAGLADAQRICAAVAGALDVRRERGADVFHRRDHGTAAGGPSGGRAAALRGALQRTIGLRLRAPS